MKRRTHLKTLLFAPLGMSQIQAQGKAEKPIYLFVEMEVDPANEKEMINNFHDIFVPEAKKHPGFISVKLMKFRQVMQGDITTTKYRFELYFESEDLRQKWIKTPEHKRVWPTVEKFIKSQKDYPVVLYDEV